MYGVLYAYTEKRVVIKFAILSSQEKVKKFTD